MNQFDTVPMSRQSAECVEQIIMPDISLFPSKIYFMYLTVNEYFLRDWLHREPMRVAHNLIIKTMMKK